MVKWVTSCFSFIIKQIVLFYFIWIWYWHYVLRMSYIIHNTSTMLLCLSSIRISNLQALSKTQQRFKGLDVLKADSQHIREGIGHNTGYFLHRWDGYDCCRFLAWNIHKKKNLGSSIFGMDYIVLSGFWHRPWWESLAKPVGFSFSH